MLDIGTPTFEAVALAPLGSAERFVGFPGLHQSAQKSFCQSRYW